MLVNPTPVDSTATAVGEKGSDGSYIDLVGKPDDTDTTGVDESILNLAEGTDGAALTDTEYVAAFQLESVLDRKSFPVSVMLDGGRATAAVQKEIIAACEKKRSYAILSVPAGTDTLTEVETYRSTTLNADTRFAGLYGPWVKIQDAFNGRQVFIPPDGMVGAKVAENKRVRGIHFPVANKYGRLTRALDVEKRFSTSDIAKIQTYGVNPIPVSYTHLTLPTTPYV